LINEQNQPLLDILDLDVNPSALISDCAESARESLDKAPDPAEVNKAMEGFGAAFDVDINLTPNAFHNDFATLLPSIGGRYPGEGERVRGMEEYILAKNISHLQAIRDDFRISMGFGTAVGPRLNATLESITTVLDDFEEKGNEQLSAGLAKIDTRLVRCLYVPLKNIICDSFVSGLAYWTVATICVIVGILVLEVGLCIRRRSMVKPKAEGEEDGAAGEAAEERKLDDVGDQKFEERRKKRRKKRRRVREVPVEASP
jgi:hypothetical protein